MNLTARWILINIPPGSEPPCNARIGFLSTTSSYPVLGDVEVAGCNDVPDAIEKCGAVIAELGLAMSKTFDLVYPRYAVSGPLELAMHEIAWIVKDEAERRGFGFEREIPQATFQQPQQPAA